MAHLIDKDALVAELKRRIKNLYPKGGQGMVVTKILKDHYEDLLSFLDTLEVKEVDLEKYYHEFLEKEWFGNSHVHVRTLSEMMAFTAKHFFELGLQSTLTEDDMKLVWNLGDEIPAMSEEEFFKELLRRYKAKKGELK
jgi:hypothetical protein